MQQMLSEIAGKYYVMGMTLKDAIYSYYNINVANVSLMN